MENIPKANMADLLIDIRSQLLEAKKSRNEKTLEYLRNSLFVIQEFAYKTQNREFGGITEYLMDAINDYFYGAEFKSTIPSEDEIRRALEREFTKEDS